MEKDGLILVSRTVTATLDVITGGDTACHCRDVMEKRVNGEYVKTQTCCAHACQIV